MTEAVELRDVDKTNWNQVCRLRVEDYQSTFVASNTFSLAEAAYTDDCYPRAIYFGGEPVGFAMWCYDADLGMYSMWRLMIDKEYQQRGIGRRAAELVLEEARKIASGEMFSTYVEPENEVAIRLYESLGFERTDRFIEGELLMVTRL